MSSFVGHLCAGVAVYLSHSQWRNARDRRLLPLFALLAVLPDIDYFALWFFQLNYEPRFTHSLAFCLLASTLVWLCLPLRQGRSLKSFTALSVASCSHLALDFLVGVHPIPIFWPLPFPELQSPVGLLPSAGRLSLTNYYFWRNLLIECGVLLPVFAILVALARKSPAHTVLPKAAIALPIWIAFLVWSIRVHV